MNFKTNASKKNFISYGGIDIYEELYQSHRILVLDEEINARSITYILGKMYVMNLANKEPISLLINSEGGDIQSCLGLVDYIQTSPSPIITVCTGYAASAAAVILAAGNHRYAFPCSQIMVHSHIQEYNKSLNHHEMVIEHKQSEKVYEMMKKYLTKLTKLTNKQVVDMLKCDTYMTAQEAVEKGLVDEVTCRFSLSQQK